jgi:deoxyribonuclease V
VREEEAIAIQRRLAPLVSTSSAVPERVEYIAGVDISPPDSSGLVKGAVVVLSYPGLEVEEVRLSQGRPSLRYIPGLLSFRETPIIVGALERLSLTPHLILVDGQGLAHPRRFGIACHIGLITDLPTIGCAKSILRGKHAALGVEAGAWAELIDNGEVVGAALRTRTGVSPVYVSVGHKVDLPTAIRWVMACCRGNRLPEPTRVAHEAAAGRLPERVPGVSRERQGRLF